METNEREIDGIIIERLSNLDLRISELREEVLSFKEKTQANTIEIAKGKTLVAVVSLIGGALGGLLGVLLT